MEHPITPPPELLDQWLKIPEVVTPITKMAVVTVTTNRLQMLATEAARWGSDHELDAICEYLTRCAAWMPEDVQEMRNARRPKPPSLNEVALQMLGTIERDAHYLPEITDTIRRALEQLPND